MLSSLYLLSILLIQWRLPQFWMIKRCVIQKWFQNSKSILEEKPVSELYLNFFPTIFLNWKSAKILVKKLIASLNKFKEDPKLLSPSTVCIFILLQCPVDRLISQKILFSESNQLLFHVIELLKLTLIKETPDWLSYQMFMAWLKAAWSSFREDLKTEAFSKCMGYPFIDYIPILALLTSHGEFEFIIQSLLDMIFLFS